MKLSEIKVTLFSRLRNLCCTCCFPFAFRFHLQNACKQKVEKERSVKTHKWLVRSMQANGKAFRKTTRSPFGYSGT
jgi:hypothetical protein